MGPAGGRGPVWACCVSALGPVCQHVAGREDRIRQALQADSLPKPLSIVPPTQDIGQQGNGQQGGAQGRERAAAMARHPAGKARKAGLRLV